MGMVIVVFGSVLLLRIGRFQGPPAFGGADAKSALRPQRMRCRRSASISGAKPTSTRRFEAKTDVSSASTHPGSLPMIKKKKNKTKTKPSKKPSPQSTPQSTPQSMPDGDKAHGLG